MKPRVMSLVIFTCAVGLLTSQTTIPLFDSLISIFFVTIGAGAAGALNMWYEADLDKLMALSLYKAEDYSKANIPMLPITNGIEETKKKIFVYSLFMLPVIILPYIIGFTGKMFLVSSLALTVYYNYICYDLYKFKKDKFDLNKAKKVFGYSILYLFLIFVLFLIDSLI